MIKLCQNRLKEFIKYDPNTGNFTWIKNKGRIKAGTFCGYISFAKKTGREDHLITIDNKLYLAARLAYLYMKGIWPENTIDHKDRNSINNKWENLRNATRVQQNYNSIRKKKDGLPKGVRKHHKKYEARITINGKKQYLGSKDTPEKAYELYKRKAIEIAGEFCSETD